MLNFIKNPCRPCCGGVCNWKVFVTVAGPEIGAIVGTITGPAGSAALILDGDLTGSLATGDRVEVGGGDTFTISSVLYDAGTDRTTINVDEEIAGGMTGSMLGFAYPPEGATAATNPTIYRATQVNEQTIPEFDSPGWWDTPFATTVPATIKLEDFTTPVCNMMPETYLPQCSYILGFELADQWFTVGCLEC